MTPTPPSDNPLQRGEALNRAGRYQDAVKVLRPAAKKDPGDPWLRCALAEALLQSDDAHGALAHALAALQINPMSPLVLQMAAEAQLELGQADQATQNTSRLIELSPHAAGGYDLRGRINLKLQNFRAAEADFREAIRLEPGNWALHNNLGIALRHQKREQEAVDELERAVKANPSSRRARHNLFAAASAYQTAGGLIVLIVAIRILTTAAINLHLPVVVAESIFFGGSALAVIGALVWRAYRRRRLNPYVNRLYSKEWIREHAIRVLRYLFRAGPVFAVVIAVIWLGVTQKVGFLPWIIAGGVFVVVWWFAWRPAWRRLATILGLIGLIGLIG